MATPLTSRVESWVRDQAARLLPWAPPLPVPRWPWPPLRAPVWPGDRRRQRERMFREEFERRSIQLRELCRAVRVDTVAELQELLCAMVLAECVYKRPVSEMLRYINKFKSDFGGNIISLERVQPSLDHVPHRYLLAEAGDTLFATFIGTNQYKDIIADVNILQGTVFHEDTAQDLADAIDSEQNNDQNGEENIGVSCREKPKQLLKSKPAAHRGFLARAKGIPALELYKLAQKKNRKLVLCGHSLGGAVAALATLAILRILSSASITKEANKLQVKCITFSQPPVGNAALRDYVHRRGWQDYFKSYCIPEDVVPRILSPAYFHHYNAQTPEASFVNTTVVKSEENKETSTARAEDNNGEQLVLGVGPVQKSLWRLSKLVPLEGMRKSLIVFQKQANIFGKASTQLDSYLQSKVDESEEEPRSLEIQEGSEGIALTPLSDNRGGLAEENIRSEKSNASEVGGSQRWGRVPSLPSYVPFGEVPKIDNHPQGSCYKISNHNMMNKAKGTPPSLHDGRTSLRSTRFQAGGDDAAQHLAFTIGPHHATPTTRTKVNSFHLLPSIGYCVNGILLETNAHDMTRSMTMMSRGDNKDELGAKTPKKKPEKEDGRRIPVLGPAPPESTLELLAPGPADRNLRQNSRSPPKQTGERRNAIQNSKPVPARNTGANSGVTRLIAGNASLHTV